MITSAGVGSGIDVESLITGLMNVERQPLNNIQAQKSAIGIQISAFGTIKSQMSSMKDLAVILGDKTKFGTFEASSSDEDVFTATTDSGAIAENHDINVLSLAQSHRLTSGAYADESSAVGEGSYSFSSGGSSFNVSIDSSNNTLKGLRDAINEASDNSGISASMLNVDGGSRLILKAKEGGTANAITAPVIFSELTAASDATFEINGFLTTSSSNTVSDVVPGITLDLKSVGTAQLTSARDEEALRATLNEFIQSYNTIISTLSANSDGVLRGDNTQRSFEQKIREEFFSDIDIGNGSTMSPLDLGFTFDKLGVLSIDEDKFSEITTDNLESFVNAFTKTDTGFAQRIENTITIFTEVGGIIDTREDGLDARTSRLDDQIERFEFRLEQTETRYRRQFTAMDQLVAQLRSGSEFLINQLSNSNG